MPLYVYRCVEAHKTEAYRATAGERDNCPTCTECANPTTRILYPGIAAVDRESLKRARGAEAGQRLLNSEYGDPQRRKQYFPMKGGSSGEA
jgi:hypothetical protein